MVHDFIGSSGQSMASSSAAMISCCDHAKSSVDNKYLGPFKGQRAGGSLFADGHKPIQRAVGRFRSSHAASVVLLGGAKTKIHARLWRQSHRVAAHCSAELMRANQRSSGCSRSLVVVVV